MKHMKCPKCNYSWESRVNKPKACPRCKTRLDVKRARRGRI
jgi:predicted Zn-ribbon and HTH transcriptional regulator